MTRILYYLSFVLALASCTTNHSSSIEKLWMLQTMEVRDSTTLRWSEWRGGMQGYLLYDDQNHVSIHLIPKGYEQVSGKYRNFTDTMSIDKLKHISNNYNYMGTYQVDLENHVVSHHRLSHSNPNDWGVTVQRRFHFSGDTLIITPVEKKNANLRLKWLPYE